MTSVSANYNCGMLRRIVYWIIKIASCILGAIGVISIPSDLKEWAWFFAVISNYLPDWTPGVAMVVVAFILFFAPNWWGYVLGGKVENPKQTRKQKAHLNKFAHQKKNLLPERLTRCLVPSWA